jgi:hypothetical protein
MTFTGTPGTGQDIKKVAGAGMKSSLVRDLIETQIEVAKRLRG